MKTRRNKAEEEAKKNTYIETLNKEYIERIHQMSYSSLSENGMFADI